jgi:hypothetical protein
MLIMVRNHFPESKYKGSTPSFTLMFLSFILTHIYNQYLVRNFTVQTEYVTFPVRPLHALDLVPSHNNSRMAVILEM